MLPRPIPKRCFGAEEVVDVHAGLGRLAVSLLLPAILLASSSCGDEGADPDSRTQVEQAAATACGEVEAPIEESAEFTPYESRHGQLGPPPTVAHQGADLVSDDVRVESINGLELQAALRAPNGHLYQYFLDEPIEQGTTRQEFQAAGGIQLDSSQVELYTVAAIKEQVDRAVSVAIGDSAGVVIWADPEDSSGRRMHHVYWQTGEHLFGLIIDASAEEAVETARHIACHDLSD